MNNNEYKKVTINDVAAYAQVSTSTVSMALNGKGRISENTIARINHAIEALGYLRNQQAASLRGMGSSIVGVIVSDIADRFNAEMIAGVESALELAGKTLLLTQCGKEGKKIETCFDSLIRHGVEGIILGSRHLFDGDEFKVKPRVPLVCALKSTENYTTDLIKPDNGQAAQLATTYLIKQGHRQIAYFGGNSTSLTRAERIGGFCSVLLQYGLPFHPEWVIAEPPMGEASLVLHQFLIQHPTVTAMLCHDSNSALDVFMTLGKSRRQIGTDNHHHYYQEEISLIYFDESNQTHKHLSCIPAVVTSARDIGYLAGERLLNKILEPHSPIQQRIIPSHLYLPEHKKNVI